MLSEDKYIQAIALTQIVSIDLIVFDENKHVLLGKRKNNPAKGTWFVPGGKVYKNELWRNAIPRLSKMELGTVLTWDQCMFLGVNDHIYNTNFCGHTDEKGISIPTHYVCIAVQCSIHRNQVDVSVFSKQHEDLKWLLPEDLVKKDDVHEYTKKYFTNEFNWA